MSSGSLLRRASWANAAFRFEALIVPSLFVEAGVVRLDEFFLLVDLGDRFFGVGLVVPSSSVVSLSELIVR